MDSERLSAVDRLIRFCLENRLVVILVTLLLIFQGLRNAPFDWDIPGIKSDPVAVDAIPDIGENQQIVFTEWMGRSPQDVDDQITYPLTAALLGIPKVKTVRSYSMFGFSSIYVIFEEDAEFYWSRSRILEKLNSLPMGTLPQDVTPMLGPDATALGQVFWYTLEGRDEQGKPAPGWTPQELRSIQDYYVRYGLQSAKGVSEVASVGGYVKEYQIDVDPDAMRAYGVTLDQVYKAVQASNVEVGARTIEINRVEYVVRGEGFLESLDDLRKTVVAVNDNVPITLERIASVQMGPALRRGALDKAGAEAVGGVVVARYGANPMSTIQAVKKKIEGIAPGLPKKELADGRVSQVTIVPFYDRTGLIDETLQTLRDALEEEILVTIVVVLLLVWHLRSGALISLMLPLAVLLTFIGMKLFGVDANIVALSGIAIAIGTIVDMGIVVVENVLKRIDGAPPGESRMESVFVACREVGGAVLTAVMTTIIGFLPVFAMVGAEGKLFRPLAYTKTFALAAAIIITLTILPSLALSVVGRGKKPSEENTRQKRVRLGICALLALLMMWLLSGRWEPLGPGHPFLNGLFVFLILGGMMLAVWAFMHFYEFMLRFFLRFKILLIGLAASVVCFGMLIWTHLGREFMPALDEGSFLWMPSIMPHGSIGEALDVLRQQDQAINAIPEVESVVGKIGRVDSPLDPAPIGMMETVINYKPEFGVNEKGERVRLWRDHIRTPEDIWQEIASAAQLPGVTMAPKLQPIETRLIMLQTGMRASMGLRVKGPDLETIEKTAFELEELLREVPSVRPETVFADRIVGKPYLEIDIDREAIARYGISVRAVQDVIEVAVGGRRLTTTVEGRERYPVRVRYQRELRDSIEELPEILVPAPNGAQIPLGQLAHIDYVRGPMEIKSENTFKFGYVIFDRKPDLAEVDVVEEVQRFLKEKEDSGEFVRPAGVEIEFTGTYENQQRAAETLSYVMPVALVLIFLIIYLQFRRVSTSLLVFSGVFVAWGGGFIMIWLYNQPWFLDVNLLGANLRDVFHIVPVNMSVAVWVGFLALFGIATDDGVLMGTYLKQLFAERKPATLEAIRETTIEAAKKRNRPAMMTTATTLLALLPVLTSSGRGSDVMIPMAIPTFGGMVAAILTVFVVPTLYCEIEEFRYRRSLRRGTAFPE